MMKTSICVEVKSGIFTLVRVGVEPKPKDSTPQGQLYIKEVIRLPIPQGDLPAATEMIKRTVKDKGLENNKAIVIASESDAFFKKIYIPVMPSKEIKKAVMWQVSSLLPFDLGGCIFSYKVVGRQKDKEGPGKIAVLIGAIEKEKADKITNFIFEIGLLPVHLILPVTALGLLLGISPGANGTTLFLDIAKGISWFRVYKEAEFQFERILELGESNLDEVLMSTRVSEDQLNYFKKEYGLPTVEDIDKAGAENIPLADMGRQARAFVERLTIELRKALKRWVEESGTGAVERMYLMGNLAHFRHLAAYLSKGLGFEVTPVSHSSLGLQVVGSPGPAEIDLTLLGCCLGGSLYKPDELDFLPLALKLQKRWERVKVGVRISLAAILLSMLLLYLLGQSYSLILKNNIKNKKSELARLRSASTEFESLQRAQQRLSQQLTFYYSISGNQPLLAGILKELTNITPAEIVFEKMTLDGDKLSIEGIAAQSADSPPEASLSQFMKGIENSPFFKGVSLLDLKEYLGKETGGRYAKFFSLQTHFRQLPVKEILR